MANYERHSSGLPMIVKFVEHFHNGVQSHTLSRYAIGYIVRGEKHIYNGDKRQTISKGDVFFLGIGTHYTEEVPDESNTFEQILFYYQPAARPRSASRAAKYRSTARCAPCGVRRSAPETW